MIRSRLGLLGLCAVVLGVMAFSASAAQAEVGAKWLILTSGGVVKTGEELNAEIKGEIEKEDAALLTKILGIGVRILCTSGTLNGKPKLIGEGKISEGKVSFSGCKTFLTESGKAEKEFPECKPHSKGAAAGTVETELGLGEIVLHILEPSGTKDELTLIHPAPVEGKESTRFVTLEMESTCPIGEKVPVSGELFLKDCESAFLTHLPTHLVEEGPLTELWVLNKNAEHKATIDGSAKISLAGAHAGLSWGGMPG